MKRITALLLAITIFLSCLLALTACHSDEPSGSVPPSSDGAEGEIVTPSFTQNDRGTIKFSDIVYERPNAEGIISGFIAATDMISKNEISYEAQCRLRVSEMRNIRAHTPYTDQLGLLHFSPIFQKYLP